LKTKKLPALALIAKIIFGIFLSVQLNAQMTIDPGGFITILEGGTIYIGTDLNINSINGASGYFVDRTIDVDVTITGNISVDRYMTADLWHNVSSPVSNETSAVFTGTDLVFYYDETIILNDWNFGWVMYSGPLSVFEGYDVLFWNNPVTVTYSATGAETLNSGSYSKGLTTTAGPEIPNHIGWNLCANPYPSPCDWLASSGWNKSNINDVKYIWDGSNSVYTIFVGGGSPVGINGGTRYIPSNQGFWVQAVNNGNFSVNNNVRTGDITGTPDFYKSDTTVYPMLSLVSTGEGYRDEVMVRFIEGTSAGFDVNFDASKLFSRENKVPQLTIVSENKYFALNTYPEIYEDLEIPMDFRCAQDGQYTISLGERTNLEPQIKVYLKDNIGQNLYNLNEIINYNFIHSTSNNKNRFTLYFNPSADILNNITTDSYFSVYSAKNQIIILKNTVKEINGDVNVYNMSGQTVYRQSISNSNKSVININKPSGYYIVNIIAHEHVSNSKILIIQGNK